MYSEGARRPVSSIDAVRQRLRRDEVGGLSDSDGTNRSRHVLEPWGQPGSALRRRNLVDLRLQPDVEMLKSNRRRGGGSQYQ